MVRKKLGVSTMMVMVAMLVLVSMTVSAEGSQEVASTGAQLEEIDAYLNRVLIEEDGRQAVLDRHYELTGVRLEVVMPPHNQYSQVLTTAVMAGEIPDIMELPTNDYPVFASQGLLVPLDDYIAENPNTAKIDPAVYEGYRLGDGNLYGLPTYRGGGCVTYLRQDWLDALDLDTPVTWDEYVEVLRAFTYDDPDGNGEDDTIGLAMPYQTGWEFDYYNRFIMQDAYLDFQYKDGQWHDGFTQPEMRAALQRWINVYEEGILDPEFFTDNTGRARAKIMEGRAGVLEHWVGTWGSRLHAGAANIDPDANLVAIPAIEGAHYIDRIGPVLAISTDAENPQAVFNNVIGTMWDQGEGQINWTYGVEGTHWEAAPAGSDYEIQMLPQPSNPDRNMQKAFIDPPLALNLADFPVKVQQDPRDARALRVHSEDAVGLSILAFGEVGMRNVGELRDAKREVFAQIVSGQTNIDEGMRRYRDIAGQLQVDQMLSELNS